MFFFVSYLSILLFSFFLNTNNFNSFLSYETFLKSILTSIILWYILYLSSFHKIFYTIVMFFLALVLTMKIYYTFFLGVQIEPSVFEGIFDTNIEEAQRLGSNKPIFIFVTVVSFLAIVIEFNWLKSFPFKKRILIHLSKVFIILLLLFAYGFYNKEFHNDKVSSLILKTFPINFVNGLYISINSRFELYKMNQSKIDIAKKYNFTLGNDDNVTVVFIRAESIRARSFPIKEKHIPLSRKIDNIQNIIFYNNVFSYANHTSAAVPWMLSRSMNDELKNEKSFISVLTSLGFNTTWLSIDRTNRAKWAHPISNYSTETNNALFAGKMQDWIRNNDLSKTNIPIAGDGKQFSYVASHINNAKYKKYFFWVELSGCHVPWKMFPKEFTFKKPLCRKKLDEIKECSQTEAENSYYSNILYTQYLVKKLIKVLQNKNAIVFFASDHGESTGENGNYGHGFMLLHKQRKIRDQVNPAFMVWMSDTFKSKHIEQFDNLKNNSKKYMKHDVIFHSVLDLLDIKSEIIDENKSIFSNSFQGRSKAIANRTVVNIQENEKEIIFTVLPQYQDKKYQIAFYIFNGEKRVDTQWYSRNYSYVLDKKQFGKGIYRIKYFMVDEKEKEPAKGNKLDVGESADIEIK